MQLNDGQQNALSEVVEAYSSGASDFYLSGPPGSGKTVMAGTIVNALVSLGASVAFCASTNSALVRVKSQAISAHWVHLVKFWGTAHKLLGLYYDPVADEIGETGHGQAEHFDVVFVDESSALPADIVAQLRERTRFLIFVGDKYQLLPVNEDTVTAFTGEGVVLTEIMRQSDADLISLISDVLKMVKRETEDVPVESLDKYATSDLVEWQSQLTGEVDQIAIAFANDEVARLNRVIRANMGMSDQYCVGDRLVFTAPFFHRHEYGGRRQQAFSTNTIVTVRQATRCNVSGFPCWSLRVKSSEKEDYIIVYDSSGDNMAWIEYLLETEPVKYHPSVAHILYAYALTAHRAMGCEWDRVYVQMRDFSRCWREDDRSRLLYTSITRARETLSVLVPYYLKRNTA